MMSLQQIAEFSRAAARRTRRLGVVPVTIPIEAIVTCSSIADLRAEGYKIPFIGDRRPKGFKPLGEPLFVDTSGFGRDDEPALSFRQSILAMRRIVEEHGSVAWATISHGQFQAYLQAYKVRG